MCCCCCSCCGCFKSFLLLILSCATLGIIFVVSLVCLLVMNSRNFAEISTGVFAGMIVAVVLSGLLLIFAIVASTCAKKSRCAMGTLGALFLVFVLLIIIFVSLFWTKRESILNSLAKTWEDPDWKPEAEALEASFKCCGFDHMPILPVTRECVLTEYATTTCRKKLDDFLKEYANIVGIILIIMAVLLVIGAIIAFCECASASASISPENP